MSDQRELIEHNRKVIADITKNNSRAGFEKRQEGRNQIAKDIANEALDYVTRKGTGTHESNQKLIDDVTGYYKPDFLLSKGKGIRNIKTSERLRKKKAKEANDFFKKIYGIK